MSLSRLASRKPSAALSPLRLDFDPFLYAQVGDDQRGGLLSVVSALARVGVDPWEEAALLARLPLDAAVRALSVLLEKLPAGSGKPADPIHVATRLVRLLPHASPTFASPTSTGTVLFSEEFLSRHWRTALFYLATLLLLVGLQLVRR